MGLQSKTMIFCGYPNIIQYFGVNIHALRGGKTTPFIIRTEFLMPVVNNNLKVEKS